MVRSKVALAAVLGLLAAALPRPELDHEGLARRRLAKKRLDALDETLSLNRQLIAGGAYDVNALFNVLQVTLNRNATARQVYGESMQLLREYEAVFPEVCRLHDEMLNLNEKARPSERVGGSYGQLRSFVNELRELKAKFGVPPGEEEAAWTRFVARYNRETPPTSREKTAAILVPPLVVGGM
jgi:hypothetical protein